MVLNQVTRKNTVPDAQRRRHRAARRRRQDPRTWRVAGIVEEAGTAAASTPPQKASPPPWTSHSASTSFASPPPATTNRPVTAVAEDVEGRSNGAGIEAGSATSISRSEGHQRRAPRPGDPDPAGYRPAPGGGRGAIGLLTEFRSPSQNRPRILLLPRASSFRRHPAPRGRVIPHSPRSSAPDSVTCSSPRRCPTASPDIAAALDPAPSLVPHSPLTRPRPAPPDSPCAKPSLTSKEEPQPALTTRTL